MEDIRPLSRQQQIFLQRLFALHVLTESQAQSLFDDVLQLQPQRNELGRDVRDTFKRINRSLIPAFRLEIKSVSLALSLPNHGGSGDSDDDNHGECDGGGDSGENRLVRPIIYHSIVNCDSDEVAKTASNPTFTKSPHEFAFFRLLLEKFIEEDIQSGSNGDTGEDRDTSFSSSNTSGKGCKSRMSRIDMINARNDLTGPHEGKVTIAQAESVLDLLEVQGWFVPAASPPSNSGEGAESMSSPSSSARKRRRNASSGSGSGSSSAVGGGSKYLQIGPRSYLEYPDFLIKVGLDDNKLPQFLVHG
mmetsp:Transcript_21215/g.31868  ORF Transcript_21215/g.31868 Transcript_21215/m.31868 type:complete len:304 (+) Transcript_21215:102-1013(+)|eukprot:CAMPEP_0203673792 /NCGR_PEP_ID=MMETSP0090-20130426/13849_1 /ASSEMBLY_ACC=CAM_ASM_001088 /TAXON_ID=426623 /ORGANISM="Chaetoceros affinis, Strain CCMP159" /LENGTH=303 /DNA_ID=CAMNT_0050539513 /DNA_START=42 /DNA_END=953 /DNA_ORIENTATION=+